MYSVPNPKSILLYNLSNFRFQSVSMDYHLQQYNAASQRGNPETTTAAHSNIATPRSLLVVSVPKVSNKDLDEVSAHFFLYTLVESFI